LTRLYRKLKSCIGELLVLAGFWHLYYARKNHMSIREFFPRSHAGHPARNIGGNECVCTGLGAMSIN
jgi:hypothetical protein